MQISVACSGRPTSESLRAHLTHRIISALERHASQVETVHLTLHDAGYPGREREPCCRIVLTGKFGTRRISVHDRTFKSAIDGALRVSLEAVSRALDRGDSTTPATAVDRPLAS